MCIVYKLQDIMTCYVLAYLLILIVLETTTAYSRHIGTSNSLGCCEAICFLYFYATFMCEHYVIPLVKHIVSFMDS